MRVALLVCACLVWLIPPASAEDFSGFYAGVNAGYAFQKGDRDKHGFGSDASGHSDAPTAANALPPSAQDASRALQTRNRNPQGSGALPR